MSNFHFLKKDLEWKIVNLQCWGPHSPHNPTTHNGTLSSFKKETIHSCTLTSFAKRIHTHRHFCSPLSVSLLYSFKRENIPFLGVQKWVTNWDMSDVYTCTPSSQYSPFYAPYFLSWVVVQERKLYTRHYTLSWELQKWVTNWDMSRKSF